MKCTYCGTNTDYLTTTDAPICNRCAEEKGFILCTESGKYIANKDFNCDKVCNDCVHME